MKKRDDFSAATIKKLQERVAHRCSNPECRVPTIAPKAGTNDESFRIGQAAHICAAAPGGPRYLTVMTPSERSAITNAIWLCSNCARKIDVDEIAYSISCLQEWKRQAEEKAAEEVGKQPPRHEDAREQVLAMMGGCPSSLRLQAISNVHAASKKLLDAADPRLAVQTEYVNGVTNISIHARESVELLFKINPSAQPEWSAAMSALVEHGYDVQLPTKGIHLEGSPLFDSLRLNSIDGTMKIEAQKKDAVVKFSLISPCGTQLERFDDLHGSVISGTKTFTFEGVSCGGLFEMRFSVPFAGSKSDGDFDVSCNLHRWIGKDIRRLPYLQKIKSIFLIRNLPQRGSPHELVTH